MTDASHAAWKPLTATAPALLLSVAQRASFAVDGFLALRHFVSEPELSCTLTALDGILADLDRVPPFQKMFEKAGDVSSLKQLQALHTHSPELTRLATQGGPAALAAAILGDAPVLQNLQYFCKGPGGKGLPTPPHQDSAYFFLKDPSDAVTLWLSLDDVDEENGAIAYVRGSHLLGLRPHIASGILGFSRTVEDWGEADVAANAVQCAAPGDLLLHHGLTIHSAGANVSATRFRRALGFIYFSSSSEVDGAAKAAYHEKLYNDLHEKGRI